MYQISKRFDFSASHQLVGLPPDHPCARLHGHNYQVEVILAAASLDPRGFVEDYGNLTDVKEILATLDHRHLNDLLDVSPTAENLAHWLYDRILPQHGKLVAVRVSETPKTWAEYYP